ncbi:putative reverse transcriptase domain-containing protein, partial [Tanacetum coccineum]
CELLNGAWFLESKREWGRRRVKEKDKVVAVKDVVSPFVIDELVVKEKQSSLVDTSIPNVEKTGLRSYPPLPTHGSTSAGNTLSLSLYANISGEQSRKALNFRTVFTPRGNGVDVVVPVESIRAISKRFVNTAYGFFLGKRVAYPVVANYVRNTWGKYGLVRSMLNSSTGLFSFQFSSMDGLNAMLENDPWFIRNHPLILKKWNPDVNLLIEDVGNVPVWVKLHGVPVMAFSEDGLSDIATKLGTPLMLDSYTSDMCMQSWGRSSYAREMIELQADVELKDTIVVVMHKLTGEGFYTCTVRVEYEWKPPRCACCKVFGQIQEECPKNPGLGVAKNLKKPSQAPRGVPVGSKNDVEPTTKVSNSNLFNVLNSVENDMDLGTNGGTSNLFEKLIIDGKVIFVDDEGKPVKNVDYPIDQDSEDETASVDNDVARSMASENVGFGTNSLLEQWRDTYENDDYDYDPYDDDMFEGQEIPDKIQAICDNLDIKVRGRKKK